MNHLISEQSDHQLRAEYEALRRGVAVLELPTGKLQVSGKNAVQFLNGLVSNDVKHLAVGAGVFAAFPTLQGKVAALCRIYNPGTYLLLELAPVNRAKIVQNLNRFVPAGEFFVNDVSEHTALLSLQGPQAGEMLAALTEFPPPDTPYRIVERSFANANLFITTHARCGETGFDLFVKAADAPRVREVLLSRGVPFGARAVGAAALEIARIEAGVPREPDDVNDNYILLETGCDNAVSYTKGCYLGQEIIARIHWRGQPAKRLQGLLIEAAAAPSPGTELYAADGKKVGEITSSTHSPALDRFIALGYVHRYHLADGTEFTLKRDAAEIGRARLTATPFVNND